MPDNTIHSKLAYIYPIRKLITISVIAGIVTFVLYYYSESDFFLFAGLFLLSWALLYGLGTFVYLLLLVRRYKMLAKPIVATLLLLVVSFAVASVLFYFGFKMFLQFSD